MEIAVWLIAGIFALNAFVLGASVLLVSHGRHRARREIRQLEALWRLGSSTSGRRRVTKTVAFSTAAAIAFAAGAVAIRKPERLVTSALGVVLPVILGDGGSFDRSEVRASGAFHPGPTVVHPAGGTPRETTGADPQTTDPGSSDGQIAPTVVEAQPRSSTVIRVSWSGVVGATGYDVERSTTAGAGWITIATTRDDETAYVDEGLSPEETYFYRVLVLLEDGVAAPPSDVVSATTLILRPVAPVLRTTVTTSTTIALVWGDVAEESSYRIERSADGETGWIAIGTGGQDVTTYEDSGLPPGTTYHYRVVATNEGGASPSSNVVSATTEVGSGDGGGIEGDGGPGGEPAVGEDQVVAGAQSSPDAATATDAEPAPGAEPEPAVEPAPLGG